MKPLAPRFDAAAIETETARFWRGRPTFEGGGPFGPPGGPVVHQLLGTVYPMDDPGQLLEREVLADAEARFLAMSGRRTVSNVRILLGPKQSMPELLAPVGAAGVHLTDSHAALEGPVDTLRGVNAILARLAEERLLVLREQPVRVCPRCRGPRSPELIVYQDEEGSAYLVRFPIRGSDPKTSLLVWTDSVWKLLGTTAVMAGSSLSYVTGRYRRKDVEETVVVAKAALPRLAHWLPGSTFHVLDERDGLAISGIRYDHPLAVEYPAVGSFPEPAGTVIASSEIGDSGSGFVGLVPAHGSIDSVVAARLQIPGWPVVRMDGQLDRLLQHKYAGLPLEVAEAFILRDLQEGGFVFAELRVRRGIPHCAACGSPMLWLPLRTWCLDPSRLSPEVLSNFARLLPREAPLTPSGSVPWPVSSGSAADDPSLPALSECSTCDRLAPPAAEGSCECGGTRGPVHRSLLPGPDAAITTWALQVPFPSGEAVRFYLPDRRRAPTLVHQLMAMQGAGARPSEIRLSLLPTLPPLLAAGAEPPPSDAVRAALLRTRRSLRVGPTLLGREAQEARRLRKVWTLCQRLLDQMISERYEPDARGIVGHLTDLLEEDRAFLSSFERMRVEVVRRYEAGEVGSAHALLAEFMDLKLRGGYLPLVRPRLRLAGLPPIKVAAYRVLLHVLLLWVELYSPIAPFTMEAIHRAFRDDAWSLVERPFTGIEQAALDADAEKAFDRWMSVVDALNRGRKRFGIAPDTPLSHAVLVAQEEEVAVALRVSLGVIARLTRVRNVEVASPGQPWEGRKVVVTAVPQEIQRNYPTQMPRIVRLLQQLPGRRVQEGLRTGTLSVALDGNHVPISSAMVRLTEALPEFTAPLPWSLGEIFAVLPPDVFARAGQHAPAVSNDCYHLLRAVRRRMGRSTAGATGLERVVVQAGLPLLSEVQAQALPIAAYLGVGRVEAVPDPRAFPGPETVRGRTRKGVHWAVWVPGSGTATRRRKPRPSRSRRLRARETEGDPGFSGETDYLSDELRTREEAVRELVEQMDSALGRPIMGPTKLAFAWNSGLRTLDALTHAPFDTLSAIPGFGPVLAGTILGQFGGAVPTTLRRTSPPPLLPRISVPTSMGPTVTPPAFDAKVPPGPIAPTPNLVLRLDTGRPQPFESALPARDTLEAGPGPAPPNAGTSGEPEPMTVIPDGDPLESPGIPPALHEPTAFAIPETATRPTADTDFPTDSASLAGTEPDTVGHETLSGESAAEPGTRGDPRETALPEPSLLPAVFEPIPSPLGPLGEASQAELAGVTNEPSGREVPFEGAPPFPIHVGTGSNDDVGEPGIDHPPPEVVAETESLGAEVPPEVPGPTVAEAEEGDDPSPLGPLPSPAELVAPGVGFPIPPESPAEVPGTIDTVELGAEDAQAGTLEGLIQPEVRPETSLPPSLPGTPGLEALQAEQPDAVVAAQPFVRPATGEPVPPAPEVFGSMPPCGVEVWPASGTDAAWHRFVDETGAGHPGLCLSREFPERIRSLLGTRRAEVVWLSNSGKEGAVRPTDLVQIQDRILRSMTERGVTAVFFGSAEYLITIHGSEKIRTLLTTLHEVAGSIRARVWVPIDPDLVQPADVDRLAQEFPLSASS